MDIAIEFATFLAEYADVIPKKVGVGQLRRLTYSESLTKLTFYITYEAWVPVEQLIQVEHDLAICLEIESVRIRPSYPESLLSVDLFDEFIIILRREMSVVNLVIDWAEVALSVDI